MKKIYTILSIALLSLTALTSCNQNYVCECTTSSVVGVNTSLIDIQDVSQLEAENICIQNTSSTAGGQTVTVDCILK